ncbi:hypothetical protein L207DRAFT_586250 [Hyaloscypha variabilis F]|uniref:F-box domain-containing protein n=1 Tax=Hyaloscypha variabilis (strain UAMH 11265 / GT02V1 / F) TaxID=1149755 RepID=A0A2J6RDH0_HYAVF|nr:hypothetical protein L207DRAFT_586250 [Hyaloscypha variabilis F]
MVGGVPGIACPKEMKSVCQEHLQDGGAVRSKTIQTKGLFNFMALPPEIRVQIYNVLLVSSGTIDISSDPAVLCTANTSALPYPPLSILRTCKQVNEEATPILYGKNSFTISLPNDPSPTFLLSNFRWTTLTVLKSLTFTSNNRPPCSLPIFEPTSSEPGFHCTGPDILARFTRADFRYSPVGPNHFMALSISNWVSTKVLSAQLSAIQRELEMMMGPDDEVLTALGGPVV